ncbi:MAG: hypothetical protein VX777_08800 [Chlamydiota bacterium]|nr:hypothetical protein [Chlamydiota bacterium]
MKNNNWYFIEVDELIHYFEELEVELSDDFDNVYNWAEEQNLPEEAIEQFIIELNCETEEEMLAILHYYSPDFMVNCGVKDAPDPTNRWMIPSNFDHKKILEKGVTYNQFIVAPEMTGLRGFAKPGELLIPAPINYQPPKKMRNYRYHYNISDKSHMPSEAGVVIGSKNINPEFFLHQVKSLSLPDYDDFSIRESVYFLDLISKFKLGDHVELIQFEYLFDSGQETALKMFRIPLF